MRLPNIEVLRCALMFMIVLGHMGLCGCKGGDIAGRGVESCTVFAVDAFALISGWFGIIFSWKKVVRFLGLGLFAAIVLTALSPFVHDGVVFRYSLGWFGASYLGLMFLSRPIEKCFRQDKRDGRGFWLLYAIAMFLSWMPLKILGVDLTVPGWGGISFNLICFMYVTGLVLRNCEWVEKISCARTALICLGLMAFNIAWAAIGGFAEPGSIISRLLIGTRDNNSPLIIALAVFVFLLFSKISFPKLIGKICVYFAPSMFSVYLLHEGCNGSLSHMLYNKYLFCDLGDSLFMRILSMLVSSVVVMSVCVAIDLVRRICISSVTRLYLCSAQSDSRANGIPTLNHVGSKR